jgi:hypothetical protein
MHDVRNTAFLDGVDSPEFKNGDLIKYSDYLIFVASRNPWDKFVSGWKYLQKSFPKVLKRTFIKGLSLKEAALNLPKYQTGPSGHDYRHITRNQVDILIDKSGKFIPNVVIRFENLQEDFNVVCDKIGIPRQQLPHHNKTEHKHYTEYYDEETKQIVAEKYAKDIEYFSYKFGE